MITDAEYEMMYVRHRTRIAKLESQESFIDLLARLKIVDRRSYRNYMNEFEYQYELLSRAWSAIKEEYSESK